MAGVQGTTSVAGLSDSLGFCQAGKSVKPPVETVPDIVLPTSPEEVTMRFSSTSQDESSVIRLSGDMLFDFDRSDIKPAAEATPLKVGAHIRQKSPRYVPVEGHTDAIGDASYNMGLSNRRARSVAGWLGARNVIKASAIMTKGWGKSKPVAPNRRADGSDDTDGRAKNRRVEIWLVK